MIKQINVFPVNGHALEVAICEDKSDGLIRGLQLRKAIQHKLDARGKVSIPLEMIVVLHGDQIVADEDPIDLEVDSSLQFAKNSFPHLNFEWMMFHMWENFLGATGFACPTSCEDFVIFCRAPKTEYRAITERGLTFYAVNFAQLGDREALLQQLGKELLEAEPESGQLPPCRATVLPHLAQCEERLALASKENILVYTEAEWNIALYQEVEVKGRSREDLFLRYPFEHVIEAFYSLMSWSSMQILSDEEAFESLSDEKALDSMRRHGMDFPERNCRVADIIERWLAKEPVTDNMDYEDHPSLKDKFKDLTCILRTFAGAGNSSECNLAGDVMIRRSANVAHLAQHLADLQGCSVSDFTLLIDGEPLCDMLMPLVSLADEKDAQGRCNFQVSLIRNPKR